jgi:hypothetical protein
LTALETTTEVVIPSKARNLLSFRPARTSATTRRFNLMGLLSRITEQVQDPMILPMIFSAGLIQALIKIYVRLVIAQSIQLSNIVLVNFR